MKRTVKIISLLLILATAFTLAACTDRPADDTSATEAAASEVRTDPQTVTDRPDTEPIETEIQ